MSRTFEPFEITGDGVRQKEAWANDAGRSKLLEILNKAHANVDSECHACSIVEVGSWAGANAIGIADNGFRVFCVDHWRGGQDATACISRALGPKTIFQGFCRNVGERLLTDIIPCVGSSKTWAEIWPFKVAAVFIDADHTYESVKEDIHLWLPHVLPGGVLCGHDYRMFPGVKQAVDEWVLETPELGPLQVEDEIWARWIT